MRDSFIESVRRTVGRRRLFASGVCIGAAVSGGPDSMALLAALAALAPELDLDLLVLHLNHRLRGAESDADERFVHEQAAALGLDCRTAAVAVGESARAVGENLEQAGRAARYAFFERCLAAGDCDLVATGHTRSDQAETVLFRLLRGAGSSGLSAIRAARPPGIVRPLLDVSRSDVEGFLLRNGIECRRDPSNSDPRFARNRIRAELLPALERDWNPQIEQALARLAEQAADEEAYWASRVDRLEERLVRADPEGVEFMAAEAAKLERALSRRFLRRAAGRLLPGGESAVGFDAVERLRELVDQDGGAGGCSLPGVSAWLSSGRIRLTPGREPGADRGRLAAAWARDLEPPCGVETLDGRTRLEIQVVTRTAGASRYTDENRCFLDWRRLPRPLTLRCIRAGDRFAARNGKEPPKLRRLLQAARVPAWERATWPVMAAGPADEPVWVRGLGPSARYLGAENTETALVVRETDRRGREIRSIEDWTRSV